MDDIPGTRQVSKRYMWCWLYFIQACTWFNHICISQSHEIPTNHIPILISAGSISVRSISNIAFLCYYRGELLHRFA